MHATRYTAVGPVIGYPSETIDLLRRRVVGAVLRFGVRVDGVYSLGRYICVAVVQVFHTRAHGEREFRCYSSIEPHVSQMSERYD